MKPSSPRCESIRRTVEQVTADFPDASPRRIACEAGVSELEVLLARQDVSLWALQPCWADLLAEFPRLGLITCITANEAGEHRRTGHFEQVAFYGDIGVVLGEAIDLRLLMEHWAYGFAVVEETNGSGSFRFFDTNGLPILEVKLPGASAVFRELVGRFHQPETSWPFLPPLAPTPPDPAEETVDVAGFQEAWLRLEDTANFTDLLKQFGLRREHALRFAPKGYSRQVSTATLLDLLQTARVTRLRIMIFMRSTGCLQIHTGLVEKLEVSEQGTLTLQDNGFQFTLDLGLVASCWIVRKPTLDGTITSMELFDIDGNNLALLFGKRGYGQPEDPNWRNLLLEE